MPWQRSLETASGHRRRPDHARYGGASRSTPALALPAHRVTGILASARLTRVSLRDGAEEVGDRPGVHSGRCTRRSFRAQLGHVQPTDVATSPDQGWPLTAKRNRPSMWDAGSIACTGSVQRARSDHAALAEKQRTIRHILLVHQGIRWRQSVQCRSFSRHDAFARCTEAPHAAARTSVGVGADSD